MVSNWKWETEKVAMKPQTLTKGMRQYYLKVARELCYGPDCMVEIQRANTDFEAERILKHYRTRVMEEQ